MISIPVIRPLASLLKANNQDAILAVLRQRKAEVNGHHDEYGMTSRHNASVRASFEGVDGTGVHAILKKIAQELGRDDWDEVKKLGWERSG